MAEIAKGKYIFGTVKVGDRGQIVIPVEARKLFDIKPGDLLLVVGDEEKGIGIVKVEAIRSLALKLFRAITSGEEREDKGR